MVVCRLAPPRSDPLLVFSMLPSACTVETAKCVAVRGRTVDVRTDVHTYVQVNPSLMLMLPSACTVETAKRVAVRGRTVDVRAYRRAYLRTGQPQSDAHVTPGLAQ